VITNNSRLAFAFIVLVAINAVSCSSVPSEEIAAFLTRKGFDYEVTHPSISTWESQTFNMATKEQWETKSRAEVPNWRGAYYRFSVVKESYQSPQEAMARLHRIHEEPLAYLRRMTKHFNCTKDLVSTSMCTLLAAKSLRFMNT
jgi:hypothetical protein